MTDAQKTKPSPLPPGQRGQGRKELPEDQKAKSHGVRLTPERIEKYKALGGNKWLAVTVDREYEKLQKKKPTDNTEG